MRQDARMAGIMHEPMGRITVVYIADRGVIRVVESVSGRCLREDEVGALTDGEFKEISNEYKQKMTI